MGCTISRGEYSPSFFYTLRPIGGVMLIIVSRRLRETRTYGLFKQVNYILAQLFTLLFRKGTERFRVVKFP